jgi:Protein of unknown function (DUF3828)
MIALFTAGSLAAQNADAARLFLRSIYESYRKGGPGVDFTGPKSSRYFSSSLIALLHADQRAVGPDEVGVLDGDPLCGCQDWDAVHDLKIAITPFSADRIRASVSFALFGSDASPEQSIRSLEMTLVSQSGQWRIDDIIDESNAKAPFDLRAELEKEIRGSKHSEKRK